MPDFGRIAKGTPAKNMNSYSASWQNEMTDMLRWYKRMKAAGELGGDVSPLANGTGPVRIKNLTGSDLLRGNYVQLGDYLLTKVNHRQHWYEGNLYDSAEDGRIAILTKAVKTAAVSTVEARVIGRCTARVNVTDITHRFAVPDDGAYLLKSAAASGIGDIEVLSTNLITGTGEQEVAVVIGGGGGGSSTITGLYIVSETINPATWDGTTITPGTGKARAVLMGDTATISADEVDMLNYDTGETYSVGTGVETSGGRVICAWCGALSPWPPDGE